jgi:hypothetical protein
MLASICDSEPSKRRRFQYPDGLAAGFDDRFDASRPSRGNSLALKTVRADGGRVSAAITLHMA